VEINFKDWLIILLLIVNLVLLHQTRTTRKTLSLLLVEFRKDLTIIYKKLELLNLNIEKAELGTIYIENYVKNEFEKEDLKKLDMILGNSEDNEYERNMRVCNLKIQMYRGRIEDIEGELKDYELANKVRLDGIVYRKFSEKYS
tara:strand:+ start:1359 stop:1790 length:432 start_codon:yes stop_codon:yes gene_type:complete